MVLMVSDEILYVCATFDEFVALCLMCYVVENCQYLKYAFHNSFLKTTR